MSTGLNIDQLNRDSPVSSTAFILINPMCARTLEEATADLEPGRYRYDTFISFRGGDTRWNFICHLYHALSDAGICTFKDDMELREGEEIKSQLVRAIWSSKISVVVLSRCYAHSRWCLDELVEILHCRKMGGQLVIPVFYGVDTLDVLHQQGPFTEAFDSHDRRINKAQVHLWREALIEVYHLRGLSLDDYANDEGVLVRHLVHRIEILTADLKYREVANFPVNSSGMEMQSEASSPPQAAPVSQQLKHGVMICYRGTDTGRSFTSHLFHALTDAGINAIRGEDKVRLGEEVSHGLVTTMTSCRISVVVFSRRFAESRWCLHELAEVMKWSKAMGCMVIPVFYYIDPSDVRGQHGAFKEAFTQHEQSCPPDVVLRWKAALEAAGNLSGHVLDSAFPNEAMIVERIVRCVSNTLNDKLYLPLTTFPVGLDSRLQDINSLISADSRGVRFVGILGMGGIGKTTLAKAIYNRFLHHFEAKCFLADVRANSERSQDLVRLQEQLLHDVLRFKRHRQKVHNVDEGISSIKKRLHGRKALVVLDDISDVEQIRKLVGDRELFGSGSIVIVTTRYQDVLDKIKVDITYQVQKLNDEESLKLFSYNAFGECSPKEEFKELSVEVIRYAKGVPLALELLGRALTDRNEKEWIDTIQELKTIPNHDLQSKLRISFDALGNDDRTKKLFLEIACYFVGYDKDYVVGILDACSLFPEKGIGVLTRRGLLEVDENNKLKMHALLRDMGREIAREKSPDDPGNRSYLWHPKDALSTLRSHSGTREVEGIALELGCNSVETVSAEAFSPMRRLKLLKLDNVQIDGKYKHISKELRWLCWHNFSLNFIPDDFFIGEVVAIDMQHSNLIEVWKDNRFLGNLKILNLSHSHFLIKTPDFSRLPNLEELMLDDCIELVQVNASIGFLERLSLASFKGCAKLKNIPETMCRSESLRIINITGCPKIDKLPEDIGQIGSLTKLLADGTAIDRLPSSFGQLKKLTDLSLCSRKKPETSYLGSLIRSWVSAAPVPRLVNSTLTSSLSGLRSLRVLKLMDCDLSDDMVSADIGSLHTLEELDLKKNKFSSLPETISQLTQLRRLQLDDCVNLESIPCTPASLFSLSATNCVSLTRIFALEFRPGIRLFLTNCHKLRTISGLHMEEPDGSIHLEQCSNLTVKFREFLLKDWCARGHGEVFLPATEIPEWFDYRARGSLLSLMLPPSSQCAIIKGFTVCIIYAPNMDNEELRPYPSVYMEPSGFSFSSVAHANTAITPQDHMWAFFVPYSMVNYQESLCDVKLSADFGDGWNVKGIGIHTIKDVVPYISPDKQIPVIQLQEEQNERDASTIFRWASKLEECQFTSKG